MVIAILVKVDRRRGPHALSLPPARRFRARTCTNSRFRNQLTSWPWGQRLKSAWLPARFRCPERHASRFTLVVKSEPPFAGLI